MSGKTKSGKAPASDEDSGDEVPLSEVAKKTTAPTPPAKLPSAQKRQRSPVAKIAQESSEDLSEDEVEVEERGDPCEAMVEVEDSEDDFENLTMDDEEFEATKELQKFTADDFKWAEGEPPPYGDTFQGSFAGGVQPFPGDIRGNKTVTALGAFELAIGADYWYNVCAHTNKWAKAFLHGSAVWQMTTRKENRIASLARVAVHHEQTNPTF